jgi:hypothetical protein
MKNQIDPKNIFAESDEPPVQDTFIPWLENFWQKEHRIETCGYWTGHVGRSIIYCEDEATAKQLAAALMVAAMAQAERLRSESPAQSSPPQA